MHVRKLLFEAATTVRAQAQGWTSRKNKVEASE
jgi:hypothetical protein